MRISTFSVALGALSLAAGSLRAQSMDGSAERPHEYSSSQTMQLSELVMPAKRDDLLDAPPAVPMNASGPTHSPGMGPGPLRPQTPHEKFMAFAVATVGPRALVSPAFPAASYVGVSYLLAGFNNVTHPNQTLVFQSSRLIGSNPGAQFAPDTFRFLAEHHLPRSAISIPAWWMQR